MNKIDVCDSLIDDKLPEIHVIGNNEIEMESESLFTEAEWSHEGQENKTVQDVWVNALSVELEKIAAVDPRPVGQARRSSPVKQVFGQSGWKSVDAGFGAETLSGVRSEVPETLPALSAMDWEDSHLGVDFRPHLYDKTMKRNLLVDSGSQVCALPPDPGDKAAGGVFLKAANGSKIKCYGKTKFSIRIGRKAYEFVAYKADVDTPILGWDFMKFHRLELVWDDDGNQCIHDKKAKIIFFTTSTNELEYGFFPKKGQQ